MLSAQTNPLTEPIVATNDATYITSNSATLNGSIADDGGAAITARGFYWGADADNLENNVVSDGTANDFGVNITGLNYSTTYYYKAYATNSVGTAYGEVLQFTTEAILPTVQTLSATDIISSGATLNANVISNGGATITAHGFYWGTTADNLVNNILSDGIENDFSVNLTGLTYATTYYYKAYATNSVGTAYGEVIQFTTDAILPTVQTLSATDITSSGATLNGSIMSDGGATITARGFYWGIDADNLENNVVSDGTANDFGANITGLNYSTTYYYKAYATNSVGTSYGEVIQFTTAAILPTVQTVSATDITSTDATLNGNVISDGGATVTARGFMYGTSESSLTQIVQSGSEIGNFTSVITGLAHSTTYYYKAYATNSVGTAYGEVMQFSTECNCGGSVKVTDIDGNQYSTVLIGEQCWMAENLRTTKFADGTSIPLGSSASFTTAYRYYPNNNSSNVSTYGYLYNWLAAMHGASSSSTNPSNVQGVCPVGWHLPSDAEWTQLTNYVSSQSEYLCEGYGIAKLLASTTGWNSSTTTCAVGNNSSENNSTGFSALPAGWYYGSYYGFGANAELCSATEHESGYPYVFILNYNNSDWDLYWGYPYCIGISVRCVRDESSPSSPSVSTVTTSAATSITFASATINGNVISDGGATVTARGFVYGTSESSLTQTVQSGSGTGSFTANLTGLTSGTTYYYKAYATNIAGTAYGEVMSFTTENSGATTGTLNGHDWVDLGLPSGLRWATCNVGAITPTAYGDYFAWGETTTKTTYSSSTYTYSDNPTTLPSNRDAATANWGSGWRMPTQTELNELINNCTVTWTTQNGVNGRLFTGPNGNSIFLPAAGYRGGSELRSAGSYGFYWSSSLYSGNTDNAWYLCFYSDNYGMYYFYGRYYGFTVRAVCQSQN